MISRIFENTKPANLLIVFSILIVMYAVSYWVLPSPQIDFASVGYSFLILFILLATMLIINSVTHQNELTSNNSYAILFFGLMISLFPEIYQNLGLVFANFLCTLALWRLMTISTGKHFAQKILDASLLISFASLFRFWAIIFLLIVWISLLYFGTKKRKFWFIPFVAIGCVAILYITTMLLTGTENHIINLFDFHWQWDFLLMPFSTLFSLGIIAFVFAITMLYFISRKTPQSASSLPLAMVFLWIGLVVVIITHDAIFIFAPLSILFTVYVEQIQRKWLKESILWLFLLLPISVLLLHFVAKS